MDNLNESILFTPKAIALLVNENALDDIRIFLFTLQLWNKVLPKLYVYCTSNITLDYPEPVHYNRCLDIYSGLSRIQMENMPSRKNMSNLFHDFTVEKCNLMHMAIKDHKDGVLFCDADICWLGPLPEIPKGTKIALSRHEIRLEDEAKYGTYNAGFIYMKDLDSVLQWKEASLTSSFFEQMSLNIFKDSYKFGSHINYGWWRMFQAPISAEEKKKEWSIHRNESHSGLCVKGEPVICIHTHWKTNDLVTGTFNNWILGRLQILKKNRKIQAFLKFIEK